MIAMPPVEYNFERFFTGTDASVARMNERVQTFAQEGWDVSFIVHASPGSYVLVGFSRYPQEEHDDADKDRG